MRKPVVLITGANGEIGHGLIDRLAEQSERAIVTLDLSPLDPFISKKVDREILFLPDMYLGLWLERVTGRKLTIWLGECHVHAGIRPADIERWQDEAPDADLLVHPECGCASQAMAGP